MTYREYEAALRNMSEVEFKTFTEKFGGGGNTREWFVDKSHQQSTARKNENLPDTRVADRGGEEQRGSPTGWETHHRH